MLKRIEMNGSTVVRLDSIDINDLGNVTTGHVDLDKPNKHGNNGSVIGVYGQNGTGKSTLVQALYLIRQAIQGERVSVGKSLSVKDMNPVVECRFQIYDDKSRENCDASYAVTWHPDGSIARENLSFSYENPNDSQRKTTAFDIAGDTDAFVPKGRREQLVRQLTDGISKWWKNLSEQQQLEWAQEIVLLLLEKNAPAFLDLIRGLVEYAPMSAEQLGVEKNGWMERFQSLILEVLLLQTPNSLADQEGRSAAHSLDDVMKEIVERTTSSKVSSEMQKLQPKSEEVIFRSDAPVQIQSPSAKFAKQEQQILDKYRKILRAQSTDIEPLQGYAHEQKELQKLDFVERVGKATEARRFRLWTEILFSLERFLNSEGEEVGNEVLKKTLRILLAHSEAGLTEENADTLAAESYALLMGPATALLREIFSEAINQKRIGVSALISKVQKEMQAGGRSFIFSLSMRQWTQKYLDPRVSRLLETLYNFAMHHWYIVESLLLANSMKDDVMVLHYPQPLLHPDQTEVLNIPLSGSVVWKHVDIDRAMESMRGINEVLRAVMPGVHIEIIVLQEIDRDHAEIAFRSVLSDGSTISLAEESAGVRRMLSITLLLNAMYGDPSTTVVIDELDAFIFEHLLGQILQVLNQYGMGQLIFTSHNLHLLEVLGNRCITFTGQHPDNRYIHIRNIKPTNNLRDVYMGQVKRAKADHPLCRPTHFVEIKEAFDSCVIRPDDTGNGKETGNG